LSQALVLPKIERTSAAWRLRGIIGQSDSKTLGIRHVNWKPEKNVREESEIFWRASLPSWGCKKQGKGREAIAGDTSFCDTRSCIDLELNFVAGDSWESTRMKSIYYQKKNLWKRKKRVFLISMEEKK